MAAIEHVVVGCYASYMADRLISEDDPRINAGYRALATYWDTIGPSDPDFISYLVNPQFAGKPAWPNTRQSYRVVRPASSLIVTSDGLSDPFVGTDMDHKSGFGTEVFIETSDLVGDDHAQIRASWAFSAIENFAMNVADWGGIAEPVRQQGLLSTEFPSDGSMPSDWHSDRGTVGFLINMPAPGRVHELTMPFGPTLIVALTLLRPAELQFAIDGGRQGREELARRLVVAGSFHRSSILRSSVV